MNIDHFVITRFSIRIQHFLDRHSREFKEYHSYALDPTHLDFRLAFLESICAPSLKNQSTDNYTWIILIDPLLPQQYLDKVNALVAGYAHFTTHILSDDDDLTKMEWLKAYVRPDADWVVTTMLDDDDAFPQNYIAAVQQQISKELQKNDRPIMILGSINAIEWDMVFTDNYQWGTFSDWHRSHFLAVSCGLTMVARYPSVSLYILNCNHSAIKDYMLMRETPVNLLPNVNYVNAQISQLASDHEMPENEIREHLFVDISSLGDPVLMSNHSQNWENRVEEFKLKYKKVVPEKSFKPHGIDWSAIDRNKHFFEQTIVLKPNAQLGHKDAGARRRKHRLKLIRRKLIQLKRMVLGQ